MKRVCLNLSRRCCPPSHLTARTREADPAVPFPWMRLPTPRQRAQSPFSIHGPPLPAGRRLLSITKLARATSRPKLAPLLHTSEISLGNQCLSLLSMLLESDRRRAPTDTSRRARPRGSRWNRRRLECRVDRDIPRLPPLPRRRPAKPPPASRCPWRASPPPPRPSISRTPWEA